MAEPRHLGIGDVVFVTFKPIVKIAALTAGGAILCRKGILSQEAIQANAKTILAFLMPMLIFSTVTTSFDPTNVKSVAGIVITAFVYELMGLVFGALIWWLTPVPATWKGGVLASGVFSNWGDLILAFVLTIAKSKPFNGGVDSTRGIAFASIFMVVQTVAIFNVGGARLIEGDFLRAGEDADTAAADDHDPEKGAATGAAAAAAAAVSGEKAPPTTPQNPPRALRLSLSWSSLRHGDAEDSSSPTTTTTTTTICAVPKASTREQRIESPESHAVTAVNPRTPPFRGSLVSKTIAVGRRAWRCLKPLLSPPSLAVFVGLTVANIAPLKALFVATGPATAAGGAHARMPKAPDGQPPLDFVMEICGFGGSSVPVIGLILLGAALSQLKIQSLPKGYWKSAVGMAVLKMIVGPILGILWTSKVMIRTGLVAQDDKMLQFVMILCAGVPSATVQVYITSVYAAEGSVEMSALSAMLLVQYGLMFFSMTTFVSFTLMRVL